MATKWNNTPKFNDDVVKSTKEDLAKSQKGRSVDESSLKGSAKEAVRDAGKRAGNRNLGRLGLAATALQGGYAIGSAIDDTTGLGKKLVDTSGLGDLAENMVNRRDKVELSTESKNRIAAGELEASKKPPTMDNASPESRVRFGRNENIDEETRERAGGYKRGGVVTKMASGGSTSSAPRRGDGIAQRGKTRGKMY